MNWLDFVILGIVVVSALVGARVGLIFAAFILASAIITSARASRRKRKNEIVRKGLLDGL